MSSDLARVLVVALSLPLVFGCRANRDGPGKFVPPLTRLDTYLELSSVYQSEDRDRKSETSADETWKQQIYRESLGVEADGYVYHPNLVEYTAGGLFGLVQSSFDATRGNQDQSRSDSGTLLQYDVNARFLKKTNSPFTILSRRDESLVPRPYLSAELQTIQENELLWNYVSTKMPTSIRLTSTDLVFDPLGSSSSVTNIDERKRTKSTEQFQFETQYNFNRDNELSLDFERRSVKEDPFDIDYKIDDLRLAHHVRFGEEAEDELLSEFTGYDQQGSVDFTQYRLREKLSLKHSDTLRSWYNLEFTDREQSGLSGTTTGDQTYAVGANVEHKLYDSLVSQLSGWADSQEFDDGATASRYSVRANLDYRKTNSWGYLTANYGVEQQTTERTGGDQIIAVIDASRTFNDPDPIVLTETKVVVSSIVITDATALKFYKLGLDYKTVKFARRVEIHRIMTGKIADGETVLIDYEIDNKNDFTIDTLSQRFGVRQNFENGLSPYYRLEWQDQQISGDNAGNVKPDDIFANILGLEYRLGSLRAAVEYEDHESSITPFESLMLTSDYSHRFDYGGTLGLSARWSDVAFSGSRQRDVTYTTLGLRYAQDLTPSLSFEGSTQYQVDEDSISGDNDGIDLDLSLDWFVRKTHLSVNYRAGQFSNIYTDGSSMMLYLKWELRF